MRSADPDAIHDTAQEPQAATTVLLLIVAVVVAAVAAAVLLWRVATPDDSADRQVMQLGPGPGVEVEVYVRDREAALAAAGGRRLAVVSFTEYVSADEVTDRLPADVTVGDRLLALPASEPQVAADPIEVLVDARTLAAAEVPELERLIPTVDDADFVAVYESEVARHREIAELSDDAAIVFGALVIADADTLRAVAERADVRLVDIASTTSLEFDPSARVAGLRPEERRVAGTPAERP